jgi:predicted metal-dependent hydrolase
MNFQREASELIAKVSRTFFTRWVQFDFFLNRNRKSPRDEFLTVGNRQVPIVLVRNPRARRYVLRLRLDGTARVTIPRGGSESEARRFAGRNLAWLEKQLQRSAERLTERKKWMLGTEFYFRGELVKLDAGANGESNVVRFGSEQIKLPDPAVDLRPAIEKYLWRLAAKEFPPRVFEFAALHQLSVARVTVRNQKSRWGSCSRRGTISLNWRLIQTPDFVRDYIILHELMHLRQMNHSDRFWREVEGVCPDYPSAEKWLKQHSALLR